MIGGGLPDRCRRWPARRDGDLSPLGPVFHAGTLAGNPLATAAGLAALGQLDADVYMELLGAARRLAAVLRDACDGRRPGRRSSRSSARWSASYFGDVPTPTDFAGAKRTDEATFAAFFHAMLAEGVALAPGAYEAVFVGLAHTDAVIDEIGEAAHRAAATVVAAA